MIVEEIHKTRSTIDAMLANPELLDGINKAVKICERALRNGKKILLCGNGGSAADAQHLAAELVSKLNFDRPGLAAIALTTDTSALTAIGNDYGFDQVFARQVQAIGHTGDVLIAISTSGNSRNVLNATGVAKAANITVIGMTGQGGGAMQPNCDLLLKIPSSNTQKIQECHIMLGHIICGLIEQGIFA